LCDPERHFALVVPQRARENPALKYAIFTASARRLARLDKYKTPDGIMYQGKHLTNLTNETAVYYHDMCLKELVMVKDDEKNISDENLSAAAIILRFYRG